MTTHTNAYTISVPALNTIKATDISADAVTAFLSNRVDASRYTIIGENKIAVTGQEWLDADTIAREYAERYATA